MALDLKIINFNLESGIGVTRGYHQYATRFWRGFLPHSQSFVEAAARWLAGEAPDIAFVTEIDGGSYRSQGADQVCMIGEALGAKGIFFQAHGVGPLWNQGNAIFSPHAVTADTIHELPGNGERRILGEALITVRGISIRAFITHLSLSARKRAPQIRRIAEIVSDRQGPVILAGDFNASDTGEMQALRDIGLECATARTFPSWNPRKQLDYIFYSKDFDLKSCATFNLERFSDHLPLIAHMSLR